MVRDAKALLDELRQKRARPDCRLETRVERPAFDERGQFGLLRRRERALASGRYSGSQRVRALSVVPNQPAVDGAAVHAEFGRGLDDALAADVVRHSTHAPPHIEVVRDLRFRQHFPKPFKMLSRAPACVDRFPCFRPVHRPLRGTVRAERMIWLFRQKQEPLDRILRRGQTTRGTAIDDASMQGCLDVLTSIQHQLLPARLLHFGLDPRACTSGGTTEMEEICSQTSVGM